MFLSLYFQRCDQDVVSDFGPPQQAAAATMRVIESHSGLNSTTHWRYLMIFGAVGISGSSMCFDISNRLVKYKHCIRYTLIQFAGTCRNWNPLLFVLRFIYHVSHRFALKMWMLFGSTPHERRGILSPPVRPLVLDWIRMKQRHHSSYWFILHQDAKRDFKTTWHQRGDAGHPIRDQQPPQDERIHKED